MDASSEHQETPLVCSKAQQERKPRPQPEQALKCPRCESTNTKFCYYNNYSLSQPRYFCKSCRRYWTKGGTLRNVPVGGGCRKNRRSSSSAKRNQEQPLTPTSNSFTHFQPLGYDSNDLTLAYSRLQNQPCGQLGFQDHDQFLQCDVLGNQNGIHSSAANSGLFDALRSGFVESAQNGFHNLHYGFGNGDLGEVDNSGGEMVLPYQDLSTVAATAAVTVTTMKQEMCGVSRESENRFLWGYPWQLNADGNMADLASSWHGLINSTPLI